MNELTLDELIAKIKSTDANVRAAAWQSAGALGAAAVKPLAQLITHDDLEVGRAAKRGLWVLVRYVGRPGADKDQRAVETELCDLLGDDRPDAVRREVLWMLSEIGGAETVAAIREIPNVLENKAIRDDARCAVERIPIRAAVWALEDGLEVAPDDVKPAIAHSLRVRGRKVRDYPSEKLVPKKHTQVEPVGR